jgi:hypothetical protein
MTIYFGVCIVTTLRRSRLTNLMDSVKKMFRSRMSRITMTRDDGTAFPQTFAVRADSSSDPRSGERYRLDSILNNRHSTLVRAIDQRRICILNYVRRAAVARYETSPFSWLNVIPKQTDLNSAAVGNIWDLLRAGYFKDIIAMSSHAQVDMVWADSIRQDAVDPAYFNEKVLFRVSVLLPVDSKMFPQRDFLLNSDIQRARKKPLAHCSLIYLRSRSHPSACLMNSSLHTPVQENPYLPRSHFQFIPQMPLQSRPPVTRTATPWQVRSVVSASGLQRIRITTPWQYHVDYTLHISYVQRAMRRGQPDPSRLRNVDDRWPNPLREVASCMRSHRYTSFELSYIIPLRSQSQFGLGVDRRASVVHARLA